MKDYLSANKALWNRKTDIHLQSKMYDVPAFLNGKTSLKSYELDLLGDIAGKKILHLQCHFGQDSISLVRMGAQVVGVDLADKAIQQARAFSQQLQVDASFVCCDIFEADQHIKEQFDIVFASYGTIGWLPKLDKWGEIISHFLKPGGQFVFVEFHPVIWMLDDASFTKLTYSYFNVHTFEETLTTTYSDGPEHEPLTSFSWNHPLSDVFTSLLQQQLTITDFKEYSTSPFDCLPNMVKVKGGYQIKGLEGQLPMVYSVVARKIA